MNRAVSAYQLGKEKGINQSAISRIRSGERAFDNLTLDTVMKIQKWINDGNFKFSYDYSELIEELEAGIEEGLTDEYIYIVRGEFVEAIETNPIIDYYYDPEEISDGDVAEKVRVIVALEEMRRFNEIF